MSEIFLGLGSNVGDRCGNIRASLKLLAEKVGEIEALSDFYETEPWGYQSDHRYMNAAVKMNTSLPPVDLLRTTQEIERELGRRKKTTGGRYQDRPIDIDILTYDDLVIDTPSLIIPHPLISKRLFVLQPLAEIAPDEIHPVLQKTFSELFLSLSSTLPTQP